MQLQYGKESWYRHVCAIGGALNVIMMMSANLIGFVVGTEGMRYLATQLFTTTQGMFRCLRNLCVYISKMNIDRRYLPYDRRMEIYRSRITVPVHRCPGDV
jgi:D-alanyl-lipoteichoic acid acyltransferase DltB (MBOAT superfamily)